MKLIRRIVGKLVLAIEHARQPQPIQRTMEEQNTINKKTQYIIMYEFLACPFCAKVRHEIAKLNLDIARKDAKNNAEHKQTLINEGGKYQVPCIRIEDNGSIQWMYESDAIIQYLREQFA